jgi:hypothetical protein
LLVSHGSSALLRAVGCQPDRPRHGCGAAERTVFTAGPRRSRRW